MLQRIVVWRLSPSLAYQESLDLEKLTCPSPVTLIEVYSRTGLALPAKANIPPTTWFYKYTSSPESPQPEITHLPLNSTPPDFPPVNPYHPLPINPRHRPIHRIHPPLHPATEPGILGMQPGQPDSQRRDERDD